MTRWVALLHGVNVGGHRRVPMADLRAGLVAAGLADVRTYLQSGNVVFSGVPSDEQEVAGLVRVVVRDTCGVQTGVVVRTGNSWPTSSHGCPGRSAPPTRRTCTCCSCRRIRSG